jgi:Tfp pilus assembly protein PilN
MPLINLIQEQRLATKRVRRKARVLFFTFVATSVAATGSFGTLLFFSESLQAEQVRLQTQFSKLEPLVEETRQKEELYSELSPRLKTLEDATATTARWGRILTHLTSHTPENLWLTSLKAQVSDPTKPVSLGFSGMAQRQEHVAEFILRLQNCSDLDNVGLRYTQEKVVTNGKGIEFDVSSDIVGSETERPKKADQEEQES